MINTSEKKLYRILRNVGVKPKYIKNANNIDDLYLDDYDYKLLVYYFEHEFNVHLNKREINELTNLHAFYKFINRSN